jgi:hypothetical protein
VRIAVLFLALGAAARAQVSGLAGPLPPGDTRAQDPSPALPPAGMPTARLVDVVDPADWPEAMPGPTTATRPWYNPDPGVAPTAIRVEMGLFDTVSESMFGRPDPDSWRPLSFSTLFSEGWSEAWVPSPSGSGGAPRQAWINAVTGHLTRGWFFTFSYGANVPPKGNAYLGAYTLLAPLSRRLMLITSIPFVLRNNAESGLPIIDPPGPATGTTTQSHTGFGDISFTPRVLLHETKDVSFTAELAVLTPTGNPFLARRSALTPAVSFWTNFPGRLGDPGRGRRPDPDPGRWKHPDQPTRRRSDLD